MFQGNNLQPCNSKQLITREDFDEEIEKSTNAGNSLESTNTLLERLFCSKLGRYDLFYVEDKYVDLQINYLLEKVPQQITKTINVNTLGDFSDKLHTLQSLDQCCDFVNEFFTKKNENKQLLALKRLCASSGKIRSHEKQYISEFRRQCFALVHLKADYGIGELDFNECLTELFKCTKNPTELCERLGLFPEVVNNFENDSCFKDFLNKLLHNSTFCNKLENKLQHSAKLIVNQDNFLLKKDIKRTIEAYLKKPILSEVDSDGRICLEVEGKHIVISKVLEGIEKQLKNSHHIEEVRFVDVGVIHIDVNITASIWQGKNLLVYAETVIISNDKRVTWDVSGKDAVDPSGRIEVDFDDEGFGLRGADGKNGESGGNVLFIVDELRNAHNLTIKSNGGCGGRGQDGGRSISGRDGVFLEENSFKELFPPVSKFLTSNKSKNLESTKESLLMCFESVESFFFGQSLMSGSLSKQEFEEYFSLCINKMHNIYCELRTNTGCKISFSFYYGDIKTGCQSFFLHEGSLGEEGKCGGSGGQGGKGGKPGEIDIQVDNSADVSLSRAPGNEGMPGKAGMDGNPGKKGVDRGYTDYSRDIFGKWPKYFIPSVHKNVRLHINYSTEEHSERVFCAHNDLYAEIVEKASDLTRKRKYRENLNQAASKNEVHVQRKKAIIESSIRKQYEQKMYGTDLFKLKNMLENVKDSVLELITDSSLQTEQKTTELKVARSVGYFNKNNQTLTHKIISVSDGALTKEQYNKVKNASATELIKHISDSPSNLHAWKELSEIRLNYAQLQELWNIFCKFSLDDDVYQHIKIVFCNKYQLAVLEYLAQNFEYPYNTSTSTVNLKPNEYLLKHFDNLLTVSKQQESIDVEEYFLSDSCKKRQEAVNLFLEKLESATTNRKVINDSLLIFLNEFSNNPAVIKVLDEVREFDKSKEKTLTVKLLAFKSVLLSSKTEKRLYNSLNESIVKPTNKKKIIFEEEIQQDKFLYSLYEAYVKSTKHTFNWETFLKNDNTEIIQVMINTLMERGPLCAFYREFLANHFEINIMIYTKNEKNETILSYNHNPAACKAVYFLLKEEEFVRLRINKELVEMTISQNTQGDILNSISIHVDSFIEKNQFDDFISKKPFLSWFENGVEKSEEIHSRVTHIIMEENNIMGVLNAYNQAEDKEAIHCRLEKLKLEYTGCQSILYYMALHFDTEGAHISAEELCFFINVILKCALKMPHTIPLLCWIVAAYPQEQWLVEVILLKFELNLSIKISQVVILRWRQYLCKQTDRQILMLIVKKLTSNSTNISIKKFEETLYLLSSIPQGYMGLEHLDLDDWRYFLKDKFWSYQLQPIVDWTDNQLKSASYHLLRLENVAGTDLCKNLINVLKEHKSDLAHESARQEVINILVTFSNKDVCLSYDLLQNLKGIKISDWKGKVEKTYFNSSKDRTLADILQIIKNTSSASDNILEKMNVIIETIEQSDKIQNLLNNLEDSKFKEWISNVLLKNNNGTKSLIDHIKEFQITDETFLTLGKSILHLFSESTIPKSLMLPKSDDRDMQANLIKSKTVSVMFAAVVLAVEREYNFKIRATQKLAIMTLLKSNENVLSQVATGEGKSIIIVIVAIIKALNGQKVDIITSSHVLAERDADKYKKIYNLFGVNVDHNYSENLETRKRVYSNNNVVYGELANFQRDYLLDRFYGKNILGDRSFEIIIVDEVDSMLLDKGNNTLYLSHEISGLDKLEQVFIYIWFSLNTGQPNVKFNVLELEKEILNEIFGIVSKNDLKSLDTELDDNKVDEIFDLLVKKGLISRNGKVLVRDCLMKSFPETSLDKNHLRYLFKKILERNKKITIPNYLNQFVEAHLQEWIRSGIRAMTMESGVDYVVDVDRSETSSDISPNITIIDRDTGTDLINSQWDDGLHQFLQLKHGCRLSIISLKAFFISNVSYLKEYKTLFGLTGTIGSIKEQHLLEEIYKVDLIMIPTSKAKIFLEEEAILCTSTDEWTNTIWENVFEKIKQNRSVLIICETVRDVIIIKQRFNEVFRLQRSLPACKLYTYKRDYENLAVANNLKPGHVIISTNLAGRGTDIELTEELIKAGGLHVCLSFLPSNSRVEEQAYGRAARKGEPGSAQIIFKSSIHENVSNNTVIDLKKQRDVDEVFRIADIKNYNRSHVEPQEKCLKEFHRVYEDINSLNYNEQIKKLLLQVSLDKWAFWLEKNKYHHDLSEIDILINQIGQLCLDEYAKHIEDPSQLSKLGVILIESKKFDEAFLLFDRIVKDEPSFSENARYYRLCAKMGKGDLTSEYIISELNLVAKLLQKRIQSLLLSANLIDHLKKVDCTNILQVESFKEQQINICKIYEIFLEYIYSITGLGFDAKQLVLKPSIDEECAYRIYNDLLNQNIIEGPHIRKYISSDDLRFVVMYGLIPNNFIQVLDNLKEKKLNEKKLLKEIKTSCLVPSRELFWKELLSKQILINEEKYSIVDVQKLKNVDPSLSNVIDSLKISNKLEDTNQIWLYQLEEIDCFDEKYFVLTKKESLEREIGLHKYKVLKDKCVIHQNKQATILRLHGDIQFEYFDCLKREDFFRVDIFSSDIAFDIIHELENKNIIQKISEDRYFLLINPRDISSIKLSRFKAYSDEIVSVLSYSFAFRLALQNTWDIMDNQMLSDDPICLPLQIRLHKFILEDLYDHGIVTKSLIKPNQEKNACNTLAKLYSKEMTEETLDSIFSDLFESPSKRKDIIACLIEREWLTEVEVYRRLSSLITQKDYNLFSKKYSFQQENLKPLPSIFAKYSESIQLVIKRHISLSEPSCRLLIKQFIYQNASSIYGIETPSFSLLPISDEIKERKIPIRESTVFSLNGFDKLFFLEELKYSKKMIISTFVVALVGVTEITVSAIFGNNCSLLLQGIWDLNYVVSCIISGHFSWNDYCSEKISSVIQEVGRYTVSAYIFNSSFGQKLNLSSGLRPVQKRVIKSVALDVMRHTITISTIGASHAVIDNLLGPKLTELGTTLVERSTSDIDSIVNNHPVIESIKKLHLQLGKEKTTKLINMNSSKVIEVYKTQNDRNLLLLFNKLHIHITSCINSIYMKKLSYKQLLVLLYDSINIIQCTIDLINSKEYLKEIQLLTIANEMTDSLQHSLEQHLSLKAPLVKPEPNNCDSEAFSVEMLNCWKGGIRKVYTYNFNKWVIYPLMNCLKNMLIASLSKKNNTKYNSYHQDEGSSEWKIKENLGHGVKLNQSDWKINENFGLCEELHLSKSGISKESNIFLWMEYDDFLTGLFYKTQNSSIFLEILRNSVTADISFIQHCCSVIPMALKAEGLRLPMLQILIENDSIQQISGIVAPESDVLTITIIPDDNFLIHLRKKRIVLENLFDALYKSILHLQPKYKGYDGQYIRILVAKAVEKDNSILHNFHGYHFIEPHNDVFNYNHEELNVATTLKKSVSLPQFGKKEAVCCTVSRKKEFQQLNKIKECVIEGFNTALDKINHHLYLAHPYFKYFKLALEHFKKTKYEIIPSKQFSLCYFDCYATKYELVIPLTSQNSNLLVDYNVSMSLNNCPDKTKFHHPNNPHIVYKIYPVEIGSSAHLVKVDFEGIILLDFDYGDTIYSVKDCHSAGELML